MDTSEIHARRLNAKEVLMPKSGELCIFLVADGQSNWREEIRFYEYLPQFRITLHEVRSTTMFFKESRTGFNHLTNKWMTWKSETSPEVILRTIFIVISLNQKSIFTCLMNGHSQYHSNIFRLSGGRIRHWMHCWTVVLTTVGTLMVVGNYRGRGSVSLSSQY